MTREEAIGKLRGLVSSYPLKHDEWQAIEVAIEALRKQRPYGKWIISEVRCPYCLEYFDTDAYNEGELEKCPCCGKDMERGQ